VQFNDAIKKDLGYSVYVTSSRARQEMAILEKQSTTTSIESCFLRVFESLNTNPY